MIENLCDLYFAHLLDVLDFRSIKFLLSYGIDELLNLSFILVGIFLCIAF